MRETLAIENQPSYWSERQISSSGTHTPGPGSDNSVELQHPVFLSSASSSVRAEQRLRGVGGAERRRRGARRAAKRCSAPSLSPSLPTLRGSGSPGGEQPRTKGTGRREPGRGGDRSGSTLWLHCGPEKQRRQQPATASPGAGELKESARQVRVICVCVCVCVNVCLCFFGWAAPLSLLRAGKCNAHCQGLN